MTSSVAGFRETRSFEGELFLVLEVRLPASLGVGREVVSGEEPVFDAGNLQLEGCEEGFWHRDYYMLRQRDSRHSKKVMMNIAVKRSI